MRFLTDQDVYAATARHLSGLGHDVAAAAQLGLAQVSDEELLRAAREQGRILVTRDRDFGAIVVQKRAGMGVIYLRILPSTVNAVHAEFDRALALHNEQDFQSSFVVIEPGRHRIRRLAADQAPEGPPAQDQ